MQDGGMMMTSGDGIKICMAQLKPIIGDKEHNLQRMAEVVEKNKPDLAIFAEMYLTGYHNLDDLDKVAEPLDGPSVEKVQTLAEEHGTNIIFGMPVVEPEMRIMYNSSVLVQPNGKVGAFHKMHLANFGPFDEKRYFKAGVEVPVFSTNIGKIGLEVCYDIFFPELTKTMAMNGAQILVNVSAAPTTSRKLFETMIPARAIENTAFFMYVNLVGTEHNLVFFGGAEIVGPKGDRKAKAGYYEEEIVNTTIDMKDIDIARKYRPTLKDTEVL
jgi:predicted amidohydrolase